MIDFYFYFLFEAYFPALSLFSFSSLLFSLLCSYCFTIATSYLCWFTSGSLSSDFFKMFDILFLSVLLIIAGLICSCFIATYFWTIAYCLRGALDWYWDLPIIISSSTLVLARSSLQNYFLLSFLGFLFLIPFNGFT